MIAVIDLAARHFDSGNAIAAQRVLDTMPIGARWQVDLDFQTVQRICSHRLMVTQRPRSGNRVVAMDGFTVSDRCAKQSPDGRGLTWLFSGGDVTAYGVCVCANCPLGH